MTSAPSTPRFVRTPDANFADLADFPFEPNYLDIDGLRMHYVDEGPNDAPVALLVHGMPTWSYLYRHMIPPLRAAGFRCVAPDHIGFGRSDKVVEPQWYDIARHVANLQRLVTSLDLHDITLFVQDWGGPTGLAQYAAMPDRFSRLVIMNTWLHHDAYEYSPGVRQWLTQNQQGGLFREHVPSKFGWGSLMAVATHRASAPDTLFKELQGADGDYDADALAVRRAYDAPFAGLGDEGVTGPRRFPLCIPLNDPIGGNGAVQAQHFDTVTGTRLPVHFVWGVNDTIFPTSWGQTWHGQIPHATWDEVPADHFLQDTHGREIVEIVLRRSR